MPVSKQFWAGLLTAVAIIGLAARSISTLWLVIVLLAVIATLGLTGNLPWVN
jgi:hypothetical protein